MAAVRRRAVYRVDFLLMVIAGNLTRYLTMRPIVDAMPLVKARWYPVRTWFFEDWLRFLPGGLRLRLRHLLDSRKLFLRRPADAVVVHALDTYSIYGAYHRLLRLKTIIVNNPDGLDFVKQGLSKRLLANAVARTTLFVPWSRFTMEVLLESFPAVRDRTVVLHPGIPIDDWPLREPPPASERFRLLFIGGDAPRKGLDTLLDAFVDGLGDVCELDVATQAGYLTDALRRRLDSTPRVRTHLDLSPGTPELKDLFAQADAFAMPTRGDMSPWVVLECLATGVPVVVTNVGGIPDMIIDGETGLIVPVDDPASIVTAVERLRSSPALRERLVSQGRKHVEEHFDGLRNTERLLQLVMDAVDRQDQA